MIGTLAMPAHAERAVAPIDRLAPWRIQMGLDLGWRDMGADAEWRAMPYDFGLTALVVGVDARLWLWNGLNVRVHGAYLAFWDPTLRGVHDPVAARNGPNFDDLRIGVGEVLAFGRFRAGAGLDLLIPVDDRYADQDVDVRMSALGGVELHRQVGLFVEPRLEHRPSLYGDEASLTLGFGLRAGRWSAVPSARRVHIFAGDTHEAYDVSEAALIVAFEMSRGLTASVMLMASTSSRFRYDADWVLSRTEATAAAGLSYAWDARNAGTWGRSKRAFTQFAGMTVRDVSPASDELSAALRMAIPRLRRATLHAEEAAGGGLTGVIGIALTVAADGAVTAARVTSSEVAQPAFEADLVASLRALRLPAAAAAGAVTFSLVLY